MAKCTGPRVCHPCLVSRGPKLPPGQLEAATLALLREALERDGMSLSGLGRTIGLSKSQVSRIFAGVRPLTMEEFLRMCQVLHLQPVRVLRDAERRLAGGAG